MFKIVNDNFNSFFDNVIIDNNYSLDEIIEKELGKYILEINAIVVGDGIDSKLFYSYANEKLYKSGPNNANFIDKLFGGSSSGTKQKPTCDFDVQRYVILPNQIGKIYFQNYEDALSFVKKKIKELAHEKIVLFSKTIQDIQIMLEKLTKLLEIDLLSLQKKENKIDDDVDDDNDK